MLHRRALAASAAALMLTLPLAAVAYGVGPDDGVPNQVPLTSWPKIGGAKVGGKNVAVQALTQVGSTVVAGGNFTTVGGASRPYIAAFDATTGAVKTSFSPKFDGAVLSLLPGPTAGTVYVGGSFKTLNGAKSKSLALLNLADGSPVAGFKTPPMDGIVQDMKLANGHLYIGGTFKTLSGQAHGGWGLLDPLTGAADKNFVVSVTGHHNYDTGWAPKPGATGVQSFDITPDGTTAVVIGDFTKVNNLSHDQIAMFSLSGDTATLQNNWTSSVFTDPCGHAFDSWVRQARFSPDGNWFVVANTGAFSSPTTICDGAARFETPKTVDSQPTDHQPTWIASDGQDSIWSVAVTNTAVYVGGHSRWFNNSNGHNDAGPGAVPRPGIAALDPNTGLPLDWNPGHHPRGIGITALLATDDAVYVGSDQDFFGLTATGKPNARNTGRLGVLPFAGGRTVTSPTAAQLPGTAYLVKSGSLIARAVDSNGVPTGSDSAVSSSVPWSSVHGGFILGGQLWYFTNGALNRAPIGSGSVGSSSVVNPYDNAWDDVWTQDYAPDGVTKIYYKGQPPTLYSSIASLTGVAYSANRIYYTKAGQGKLFSRWFTADSGTIGAVEKSVNASWATGVKGMFISGNSLYVTKADGKLYRATFNPTTGVAGTPVAVNTGTTTWSTSNGVLLLGS